MFHPQGPIQALFQKFYGLFFQRVPTIWSLFHWACFLSAAGKFSLPRLNHTACKDTQSSVWCTWGIQCCVPWKVCERASLQVLVSVVSVRLLVCSRHSHHICRLCLQWLGYRRLSWVSDSLRHDVFSVWEGVWDFGSCQRPIALVLSL